MSEHAARFRPDQPHRHTSRRGWLAPALALAPLLALLLAGCGTQAGAWRLLSPPGVHVFSVVTDPNIPTLIYAGADNGSVYRARADQPGLAVPGAGIPADAVVASLLPDLKVPGRVFAGTTAGLYRSEHYGDQWSAFGAGLPSGVAALALAATPDDSLMLAGTDGRGVYRSADDGATWSPASNGLPAKATVTALTWDPANKWWWVGLQDSSDHSVYASQDGGQTWAPADGPIRAGASVNALMTAPPQPGQSDSVDTVFAATSAGVYTNTGNPQGWRKISSGLPSGAALAVTANTGEPSVVVVAIGSSVYVSNDAGVSWAPVAQGLTIPVQGLTLAKDGHGARVYYAASGQLARYPSGARGSDPTAFLLIAAAAMALLVGGFVISRRNRRFGYAMGARDNERATGRAAEAARAWERQRGGSVGDPPITGATRRQADAGVSSPVLSPTDLTTQEQTGAPADPDKAARNGHGDPNRRS